VAAVQLKRIFEVVMNPGQDANNFAGDPDYIPVCLKSSWYLGLMHAFVNHSFSSV
jgi:hypothetical protein